MASADIFRNYLAPPKSALDYESAYRKNDADAMTMRQALQGERDSNALRDVLKSGADLGTDAGLQQGLMVAPKQALDLSKSIVGVRKDRAQASKFSMEEITKKFELEAKQRDDALQHMSALQSPEEALQSIADKVRSGHITNEQALAIARSLPQPGSPPEMFERWKQVTQQQLLSAADRDKAVIARLRDLTTRRGQDITAETSRANNTANIEANRSLKAAQERAANAIAMGNSPAATVSLGGGISAAATASPQASPGAVPQPASDAKALLTRELEANLAALPNATDAKDQARIRDNIAMLESELRGVAGVPGNSGGSQPVVSGGQGGAVRGAESPVMGAAQQPAATAQFTPRPFTPPPPRPTDTNASYARRIQGLETQHLAAEAAREREFMRQSQKNSPKALPMTALKMQDEHLDAIGISGAIKADIGAILKQVETGKIKPGLINNLIARGRNELNMSTEESRNLATFRATLEKLRNDSLRLNKGVQTEGDSQRAWNELLTSLNDTGVVKQRLREIQNINERAINLRKLSIETIRRNFGQEPIDTSRLENPGSAVGGGASIRSQADAILKGGK